MTGYAFSSFLKGGRIRGQATKLRNFVRLLSVRIHPKEASRLDLGGFLPVLKKDKKILGDKILGDRREVPCPVQPKSKELPQPFAGPPRYPR